MRSYVRDLGDTLRQRHLPGLDGLRAVAVFVVITYHFGDKSMPGDLGVSGFFVLSGFLITWLLLKEFHASGRISFKDFYARRTLRIFPAYYVFITLSLVADRLLGDRWSSTMTVSAYGYLMNYFNATHGHPATSIAHAWSLAVEEQFYLLWPVLFLVFAQRGRRTLLRGLAVVISAVLIWRSVVFLGLGAPPSYVYNAFDTRFDNLAVGCLLAVILESPKAQSAPSRLVQWWWLPLVTILLLAFSRMMTSNDYHYSAGLTVDAILVAIFITQVVQLSGHPAWRWIDHPVTRYLGRISYPLYLYHIWALSVGRHLPLNSRTLQIAAAVFVAIGLASGSYYVIERPFLRLKKIFASHARQGAVPSTVVGI